ncbi:phosphoesterase family-domain-containing protein [Podospora didyma]|uniref:Phosphoesterase family-domain-containing protein n=1 Tax=Podospora didyma TaxID=330526 RepID=A0AAE0NHF4_9PEZI|nr:phosphoesterase family-domain-containing protein [Podospora didyma]
MKLNTSLLALGAANALALSPEPPYVTSRQPSPTLQPSAEEIYEVQKHAEASSPTSDVKGLAFDRIVQIWLENNNFEVAAKDLNMQWIASNGLLLSNYFAVTHPSQPNYAAAVGGDHFGMDHDEFITIPANVSTVVDLLDTKGITWGEYQEHLPYAGFAGMNFSNQLHNFMDDYVRKHNPLILYDNVAHNPDRVKLIKNFTGFYDDLEACKIPQWSFITPNMTNDAHDTNMTFAAKWTRDFLEPLLNNSYFMENTLIIVSFDENENFPITNRVYTVLLGGAIDKSLHGTVDSMYYNHYSTISTVSVNWDLPSLGRWDCDANVLGFVAEKADYINTNISLDGLYFNASYPGPIGDKKYTPAWWPAPNTQAKCAAGNGVLPSVVDTWGADSPGSYNYTNVYPYNNRAGGGKETEGPYTEVIGFMDAAGGNARKKGVKGQGNETTPATVSSPSGSRPVPSSGGGGDSGGAGDGAAGSFPTSQAAVIIAPGNWVVRLVGVAAVAAIFL